MRFLKTLAALCAVLCAVAMTGCGSGGSVVMAGNNGVDSAQSALVATDVVGTTLTTATTGGRTWYIGEVRQPIRFVQAGDGRGGLAAGETTLHVSYAGGSRGGDPTPSYEFDDPSDPNRLVVHERGEFLVELVVGLAEGGYAVIGSCWLRLV